MAIFSLEDNIRRINSNYAWLYKQTTAKGEVGSIKKDNINLSEYEKGGFELYINEADLNENNIEIVSFNNKKIDSNNDLVLSVEKFNFKSDTKQKFYKINTGNYVGVINYGKNTYKIGSRFNSNNKSNSFFHRMLSVANDVFIDGNSAAFSSEKDNINSENIVEYIIHHSFLHSVLKANAIGIPKTYNYKRKESQVYKGRLDVSTHVNKNLPFIGKFSLIYGEQEFDETILQILFWALKIIKEKTFKNNYNLNKILNKYKVLIGNKFKMDISLLNKIDNLKVLHNPIYSEYRKALLFAKQIITIDFNLSMDKKNDVSGYLINVAELWEIYLEKLLKLHLSGEGWNISAQNKTELYKDSFYSRNIIPDLVLTTPDNKIIVLDAKYKRMLMQTGDVDRTDFFQIHTYMSHYKDNLIAGGLIYPFEEEFKKEKCYSENWIGGNAKFIVDGIDLTEITKDNYEQKEKDAIEQEEKDPIEQEEKKFIDRVKQLITLPN